MNCALMLEFSVIFTYVFGTKMLTPQEYKCRAIRGSDPDKLGMALHHACDPDILDCNPVNPGLSVINLS